MPVFGPRGDCQIAAGDVFALELVIRAAQNGPDTDLTGRTFAASVYEGATENEVNSATAVAAGTSVSLTFPGEITRAWRENFKFGGLRIAIVEILDDGNNTISDGAMTVDRAPLTITGGSSENTDGSITQVVYIPAADQTIFIAQGAPGAPGADGAPGSVDDYPGVFNYDPSFLANWRAARDNPGVRAVVCWNGHSLFVGQGAGVASTLDDSRRRCVSWYTAGILAQIGFPARNEALSGFTNGTESLFLGYDKRVAFPTGTWVAGNTGDYPVGDGTIQQNSPNTSPLTWTLTATADTLRVVVVTNPGYGVLAISVDGVAATTINTNLAAGTIVRTISMGSPGIHTVTFARSSGGSVAIATAEVWNSAAPDICMLNMSAGGVGLVGRTSQVEPWSIRPVIDALTPNLVVITAGFSSLVLNEGSAASMKALLGPYIDDLKSRHIDVLLFGEWAGLTSLAPGSVWSPDQDAAIFPYQRMLYQLALEKRCVLVDFIAALGTHQRLRAAGLLSTFLKNTGEVDEVHGNAAGYAQQAALVAEVLRR